MAVPLPGRRPVRAGHRRAAVRAPGHHGRPAVLQPRPPARARAGRGDHRPGRPVPAGIGRADPGRGARHRAVREQPRRSRSWSAKGAAAADARTQTPPLGLGDRPRARRSSRTFAAATTNSLPTPQHSYASRSPSKNSHWWSEEGYPPGPTVAWTDRMQQCLSGSVASFAVGKLGPAPAQTACAPSAQEAAARGTRDHAGSGVDRAPTAARAGTCARSAGADGVGWHDGGDN